MNEGKDECCVGCGLAKEFKESYSRVASMTKDEFLYTGIVASSQLKTWGGRNMDCMIRGSIRSVRGRIPKFLMHDAGENTGS